MEIARHSVKQDMLNLERFLPYRLSVLERRISHAIARQYSEDFKLTRMQWRVLSTISMFNDMNASEICRFTGMDKMQVSRAIQGLSQQNLIAQTKNRQDQRSCMLNLTSKGRRIYFRIIPRVLDEEARIFSAFSVSERNTFHKLLHKLFDSLEDEA